MNASDASIRKTSTNWNELPRQLRVLITLLAMLALPLISWSGWDVARHTRSFDWILLALLSLLTVPFRVYLPAASIVVYFGDTFIMAIAMIYGTSPCVVAAACFALVALLTSPKSYHAHGLVFNFSSMACVAFIYSNVYHLAKPTEAKGITALMLPAAALALSSFLFSSLLTAAAVSWSRRDRSLRFWGKACLPLAINFVLSAANATFIVALHNRTPFAPIVAAPVISLMWAGTRLYRARFSDASSR